jgi:ribosomal protein S18 acetylase RimI-like enzyme
VSAPPIVRPARPEDLARVGVLAGQLLRQHHAFDALRFFMPERPEDGYRWWLGKELANPNAIVLVAEDGGEIVGYAYARLEERDWNALLDVHGALHDVLVDERARRRGIAKMLVEAACARLRELGAPRVVLFTAAKNEGAQRFFDALGFRSTMIEMTRELPEGGEPQ